MLVKILSQKGGKTSCKQLGFLEVLKCVSSLIQEAPSVLADWWGVQEGAATPQQSVRTDEASLLPQLQED